MFGRGVEWEELNIFKTKQPPINITKQYQWRIQDFSEGALIPEGAPTYYLTNLSWKLDEIEEFLAPRSATEYLPCSHSRLSEHARPDLTRREGVDHPSCPVLPLVFPAWSSWGKWRRGSPSHGEGADHSGRRRWGEVRGSPPSHDLYWTEWLTPVKTLSVLLLRTWLVKMHTLCWSYLFYAPITVSSGTPNTAPWETPIRLETSRTS